MSEVIFGGIKVIPPLHRLILHSTLPYAFVKHWGTISRFAEKYANRWLCISIDRLEKTTHILICGTNRSHRCAHRSYMLRLRCGVVLYGGRRKCEFLCWTLQRAYICVYIGLESTEYLENVVSTEVISDCLKNKYQWCGIMSESAYKMSNFCDSPSKNDFKGEM
jgi:hypothetical protein